MIAHSLLSFSSGRQGSNSTFDQDVAFQSNVKRYNILDLGSESCMTSTIICRLRIEAGKVLFKFMYKT